MASEKFIESSSGNECSQVHAYRRVFPWHSWSSSEKGKNYCRLTIRMTKYVTVEFFVPSRRARNSNGISLSIEVEAKSVQTGKCPFRSGTGENATTDEREAKKKKKYNLFHFVRGRRHEALSKPIERQATSHTK